MPYRQAILLTFHALSVANQVRLLADAAIITQSVKDRLG